MPCSDINRRAAERTAPIQDLVSQISRMLADLRDCPVPNRELAADIARTIARHDSKAIATALLQQLDLPAHCPAPTTSHGEETDAAAQIGPIGAWQPEASDGEFAFVRRTSEHVWRANTLQFNPKGRKKRIVLLGESVARGYLYANDWTPAKVLEWMLAEAEIPECVEVLDLTLVSQGPDGLIEFLHSGRRLKPDLVVVFAGNNWVKHARRSSVESAANAAASLRAQGAAGLKAFIEESLQELVEHRICTQLAELSTSVPVIFMLPDFNLADWQHVDPRDVAWLRGTKLAEWHDLAGQAEQALSAGSPELAHALYARMSDLDGGIATLGLVGQAECMRRQGAFRECRDLLLKARDCRILDGEAVPSSHTIIDQTMRCGALNGDFHLIDLPTVFADYLVAEPPDRRLFLDFCHLTSEGIRVAMAATAEMAAPLLGGKPVSHHYYMTLDLSPRPEVESTARFLASLLNAHRGQRYDIVLHHCQKAVEADPEIVPAVHAYLDVLVNVTPLWLSRAAEMLKQRFSEVTFANYIVDHWVIGRDCLDPVLYRALADTLGTTGTQLGEKYEHQRIASFGVVRNGAVELCAEYFSKCSTEPSRLWTSLHDQKMRLPKSRDFNDCRMFFRAYAPISRFSFLCHANNSIAFKLTCRRPTVNFPSNSAGICSLTINGIELVELVIRNAWSEHAFSVSCEQLVAGNNTLEIHWPLDGLSSGDDQIENIATAIERGALEQHDFSLLYPVFGEIHSLMARLSFSESKRVGPPDNRTERLPTATSSRVPIDSLVPDRIQRYA